MTAVQYFIVVFALLSFNLWQVGITGYWRLAPQGLNPANDIFGEAHRARLAEIERRFLSTWTLPFGLTLLGLVLTPWWAWGVLDHHGLLRPIILVSSGIVTWRAITMDVELATGAGHLGSRVIMVVAWIGVWFHPAFLILVLHSGMTWLRSNYHHQHLPLRMMLMFLASLGALPVVALLALVGPFAEAQRGVDATTPVLFLWLCICASHYFVPGLEKLALGPRWYSWMLDNRLHEISISAYLWGWLRFLPESFVVRAMGLLRPFDRPIQITTVAIQVGAVLILFDPRLCVLLLIAYLCFHLLVAALSGVAFWQSIVVNGVLAWTVWSLPPSIAEPLFGLEPGPAAAALLVLLPASGRVWSPTPLGWWDTPLACRVHYEVKGRSGSWYGLYNDFMCPNERIFGQTYGAFLSHEKRVNKHLGETRRRKQFDALTAVGEDLAKLEQVKEELGESRYDARLEAVHDRHITDFLRNFNAGHRKRLCPGWLKAPGGQLFYWGELPRFRGQEPVDELVIHYREDYFDGRRVVRVTDRVVKQFGADELHVDESVQDRFRAA